MADARVKVSARFSVPTSGCGECRKMLELPEFSISRVTPFRPCSDGLRNDAVLEFFRSYITPIAAYSTDYRDDRARRLLPRRVLA